MSDRVAITSGTISDVDDGVVMSKYDTYMLDVAVDQSRYTCCESQANLFTYNDTITLLCEQTQREIRKTEMHF